MTGTRFHEAGHQRHEPAVIARLSLLDRFLPLWIAAAMTLGIGQGRVFPDLNTALNRVAIHGTSLRSRSACC
jgi:arsenite transporter